MVLGELGLLMEPAALPAEVVRRQGLGRVTTLRQAEAEQLVLAPVLLQHPAILM